MHLIRSVRKLVVCLLSLLSVSIWKQLENCRTDFHKILYWKIPRGSMEPFQFLFRMDNFNIHFIWRPTCISAHISNVTWWVIVGVKNISNRSFRGKLNTPSYIHYIPFLNNWRNAYISKFMYSKTTMLSFHTWNLDYLCLLLLLLLLLFVFVLLSPSLTWIINSIL
jgi:hypothetical protein